MSRRLAALTTVALVVALIGVLPAAALDEPLVIRVYEPYSDDAGQPSVNLDLGEPGEGPGDVFIGRETLYNSQRQFGKARGARVGRIDFQLTFFAAGSVRAVATLFFPDGKIEAGGAFRFARTTVNPVLGGTGAYANARGTVEITQLRDRSKVVVRLFPTQ